MKKSILILIITLAISIPVFTQINSAKYMQQGKEFFNKSEFLTALERFDFAYEFATTDAEKAEAKSWKNKSREKIKQQQSDLKNAKEKAERLAKGVLDLLIGFLPKDVNDIYAFYAKRADSLFTKGDYENALNDYKAAELLAGDEKTGDYRLKKENCENLIKLRNEASIHFYEKNEFEKAGKIYSQIIQINKTDRNAQFMENFSKPIKAQKFIDVPAGAIVLREEKDSVKININSFKISPYEVTNAQFTRF